MNYDESEDYADKVVKYENIIKRYREENTKLHNQLMITEKALLSIREERDAWQRDAIQSKAQLGEHRIARQQEKCKRCKLEDTDRCKEC